MYFIPNREYSFIFEGNLNLVNLIDGKTLICNEEQTKLMKKLLNKENMNNLTSCELENFLENVEKYNLGFWTEKPYAYEMGTDYVYNRYLQHISHNIESLHLTIDNSSINKLNKNPLLLKEIINLDIHIIVLYVNKEIDNEFIVKISKQLEPKCNHLICFLNNSDIQFSQLKNKLSKKIIYLQNDNILKDYGVEKVQMLNQQNNFNYINITSYKHNMKFVNTNYYGSIILDSNFHFISKVNNKFQSINDNFQLDLKTFYKNKDNLNFWLNNN